MRRWVHHVVLAGPLIVAIGGLSPALAAAETRGQGTMLVRQTLDCSGTGNASTVHVPFSVLFTGFAPNETGTVTAYTQPGGQQVGQRTVRVGPDGTRCVRVRGNVPPGQYKIVYDFGSGTGKQKVIRITGPGPKPTVTPTRPTVTPTTPTDTPTAPTVTPTTPTVTPPTTPAGTVTASTSGPPTSTASSSATSSPPTRVGHLKFTQLPRTAVAAGTRSLPKTGGPSVAPLTIIGTVLLGFGALLAGTSLRRRKRSRDSHG